MSETTPPAPQPGADAQASPAPELDEYLTSGRRFLRWNLVTLVLGLVALAIGLLVVEQQPPAKAADPASKNRQGVGDATPR